VEARADEGEPKPASGEVSDLIINYPRALEVFETSDGDLHRSRAAADFHQKRIDGSVLATRMLDEGKSVGEALRAGGFLPDGCYPALDEIFQSTRLAIPHWQCRDEPGYQPWRINSNGEVFVHGHAGSWSGAYGNDCSPQDVERYWLQMKERAARLAEYARRSP
jgi:hypothetical protein